MICTHLCGKLDIKLRYTTHTHAHGHTWKVLFFSTNNVMLMLCTYIDFMSSCVCVWLKISFAISSLQKWWTESNTIFLSFSLTQSLAGAHPFDLDLNINCAKKTIPNKREAEKLLSFYLLFQKLKTSFSLRLGVSLPCIFVHKHGSGWALCVWGLISSLHTKHIYSRTPSIYHIVFPILKVTYIIYTIHSYTNRHTQRVK